MGTTKYLGRGIHDKKFYKSLTEGNLNKMMKLIRIDKDLDVQIRSNYLNIYYQGGNIARVKSEKSIEFDKFYFYLDTKKVPKKDIEKNRKICDDLKSDRNLLLKKIKDGKYLDFFLEAKKVMNKYNDSVEKNKEERMEQHKLSVANHFNKSDYTIIDLEYEVSIRSEFACIHIPDEKDKPKKPRFDIIAVSKSGKLCVIEFKKGKGALSGTSGLKEHWDCYKQSIGRKTEPFMAEMKNLLEQKQKLNLIDKEVKILDPIPEFMFAFSYDNKHTIDKQNKVFEDKYKEIGNDKIKVLKLKNDSFQLID